MMTTHIQNVTGAKARTLGDVSPDQFDIVTVETKGGKCHIYLPAFTGAAVADAINAALQVTE